jgi:23S rRNA pseudouridine1911/1915/1917 synthase
MTTPDDLDLLETDLPDDQHGDEMYEHLRIVVDPGQSQVRIDKFIHERMNNVSRNKIQHAIRAGALTVNEKVVKANYLIRPRDLISLVLAREPHDGMQLAAENIPLNIVYEDDDVMVINKPAGMVVHPGIGNRTGTLVNALAYHLQNLPIKAGNTYDRPGLTHRIDKDTSGLMLIAKTEYAMTHIAKQFFDHSIHRRYVTLVWGEPTEREGTVTGNIGRHPNDRMQMTVFKDGDEGKHAVTHYKVIDPMYYVSLVECRLETGRTHQIRVHMKHLGHPVFNDARYGGDEVVKGTMFSKYKHFVQNAFKICPRQVLHAKELGFVHPTTGKMMKFESELPQDIQDVVTKWHNYLVTRKEILEKEEE